MAMRARWVGIGAQVEVGSLQGNAHANGALIVPRAIAGCSSVGYDIDINEKDGLIRAILQGSSLCREVLFAAFPEN
jgi:hypothetical protein